MAKKTKKINPKDVQKSEVMSIVRDALISAGYEILDGENFAMTKETIVVRANECDVQLKPITPKQDIKRYDEINDDAEQEREISPIFLCILPIDKNRKV